MSNDGANVLTLRNGHAGERDDMTIMKNAPAHAASAVQRRKLNDERKVAVAFNESVKLLRRRDVDDRRRGRALIEARQLDLTRELQTWGKCR
mgnify:CR=1 FL=1